MECPIFSTSRNDLQYWVKSGPSNEVMIVIIIANVIYQECMHSCIHLQLPVGKALSLPFLLVAVTIVSICM